MRIFIYYILLGSFFFFQTYYSRDLFDFYSGYGLRSYAILASAILFISGFILLYKPPIAIIISGICSLVILLHLFEFKKISIYFPSIQWAKFWALSFILIINIIYTIVYFYRPEKNTKLSMILSPFFPDFIDKKVAAIVTTGMILILFGLISILILFIDVKRNIVREATWKLEDDKYFKNKKIIFGFKNFPGYQLHFESELLSKKLLYNNKQHVNIILEFTLDFGMMKSYKVISIDGDPANEFGFYSLAYDCSTTNNNCSNRSIWEEE